MLYIITTKQNSVLVMLESDKDKIYPLSYLPSILMIPNDFHIIEMLKAWIS